MSDHDPTLIGIQGLMKTDKQLDTLPLRERIAWRIAYMLAAANDVQRAIDKDALRSKT